MAHAMIEVRDLAKHFGPVQALTGVSFSVPRGQVVGLLGPNGAGKTTAMRIITGFLAPTAGTALVDGQDVVEDPIACRRKIGYLPEGNPLYADLRVNEALRFAAQMHGLVGPDREKAVQESIDLAGLRGVERRLVGNVSKGYQQRVGLAQALMHEPDILIFDEPTSGLDPNQQEEMRDLIRRLGEERTVLLSTHILPEVEAVCGRALIIHRGSLVIDGSVDEIKTRVSGGPAATLVVRGEAAAAEAAFQGLDFVGSVEADAVPGEAGVTRVRVALAGETGRSHLEDLAAAASRHGLALSQLTTETASLEQIFAQLTGDDEAPREVAAAAAGEEG